MKNNIEVGDKFTLPSRFAPFFIDILLKQTIKCKRVPSSIARRAVPVERLCFALTC